VRRGRGRRRPRVGLGLAVGLLLPFLALLVASPRHRQFYVRLVGGGDGAPVAARPAAPAPPPSPASDRPAGFASPIPPPAASPPAEPRAAPPRPADRPPSVAGPSPAVAAVPRGGPMDRVPVRIVEEIPARFPLPGPPPLWELKEFSGRAEVEVVRDGDRLALRLVSERASFALYRDVSIDVREFPLLSWSWKAVRLPEGGDVRERARDDQAAQVYVIFPRWPHPRVHSDVLGYIWDSQAPAGLRLTSTQSTNVKLVVVRSGAGELGQWVSEERDVLADYRELFGKDPPRVGKIAVMSDSNDTRSQAEALLGEIAWSRAGPRAGRAPSTPDAAGKR
jgi:hypothetical protein